MYVTEFETGRLLLDPDQDLLDEDEKRKNQLHTNTDYIFWRYNEEWSQWTYLRRDIPLQNAAGEELYAHDLCFRAQRRNEHDSEDSGHKWQLKFASRNQAEEKEIISWHDLETKMFNLQVSGHKDGMDPRFAKSTHPGTLTAVNIEGAHKWRAYLPEGVLQAANTGNTTFRIRRISRQTTLGPLHDPIRIGLVHLPMRANPAFFDCFGRRPYFSCEASKLSHAFWDGCATVLQCGQTLHRPVRHMRKSTYVQTVNESALPFSVATPYVPRSTEYTELKNESKLLEIYFNSVTSYGADLYFAFDADKSTSSQTNSQQTADQYKKLIDRDGKYSCHTSQSNSLPIARVCPFVIPDSQHNIPIIARDESQVFTVVFTDFRDS